MNLRSIFTSFIVAIVLILGAPSESAIPKKKNSDKLKKVRSQILKLEKSLVSSLKKQGRSRNEVVRIRKLMSLHKKEMSLSKKRLNQLEDFIEELERRRTLLRARINTQKSSIASFLTDLHQSENRPLKIRPRKDNEHIEAPRRRLLKNLVDRSVKQIEALKIDLADADTLELQIQQEREQLAYSHQELKERQSLLEFHKKLQVDILKKSYQARLQQLERYRNLKSTEDRVEKLISQFNARVEFEKIAEAEREAARSMFEGEFASFKGKLGLPVAGKVVQHFGKSYDPKSKLKFFRKGIDIDSKASARVSAVFAGKVAYSGKLPGYGKVIILDHGANYYSLCAKLGKIDKKVGDFVERGDTIGVTDKKGSNVYFEIRSKNVAVNPLQWISDKG